MVFDEVIFNEVSNSPLYLWRLFGRALDIKKGRREKSQLKRISSNASNTNKTSLLHTKE